MVHAAIGPDLLGHCVSFLELNDLLAASDVCTCWRAAVAEILVQVSFDAGQVLKSHAGNVGNSTCPYILVCVDVPAPLSAIGDALGAGRGGAGGRTHGRTERRTNQCAPPPLHATPHQTTRPRATTARARACRQPASQGSSSACTRLPAPTHPRTHARTHARVHPRTYPPTHPRMVARCGRIGSMRHLRVWHASPDGGCVAFTSVSHSL